MQTSPLFLGVEYLLLITSKFLEKIHLNDAAKKTASFLLILDQLAK